jgi:hypothetical protein
VTKPEWRRLSVREGWAEAEGPFKGVPDHLMRSVLTWIRSAIDPRVITGSEVIAETVTLLLHITGDDRQSRLEWLTNAAYRDQETALEVVDSVLYWTSGRTAGALRNTLMLGGSAWTVSEQGSGLERRVPPTEQNAYANAIAPEDDVSEHLRHAWGKVYGRTPDPSDAWDHAIKACEALLCPVVIPNDQGATLGKVIAAIRQAPQKFAVRLPGNPRGVAAMDTFRGLLEMVWSSQPDRHASGPSRPSTHEEATDVVHCAVLVTNLVRRGGFGLAAPS